MSMLMELRGALLDLQSNDRNKIASGVIQIRKILSIEKNPPIQDTIDIGISKILIQLLQSQDGEIQFESCWALTNIASGSSSQCLHLVESGIISHLVVLLKNPSYDIVEQSIWALGNIAGNDSKCRDLVLETDTIKFILEILVKNSTLKLSLMKNICWTLQNLCRGKPPPNFQKVSILLPYFERLLAVNTDEDVITDICWSMSWISDTSNHNLSYILRFEGLFNSMMELLYHSNLSIQVPTLRFVGNILTGDDIQTQKVLNNKGILSHFVSLLQHKKKTIRKEAAWAISNAAAGNQTQIQLLIDNNVIQPLIHLLTHENEMDVKKEIIWALCNAVAGASKQQILYFVNLNSIPALVKILKIETLDQTVLSTLLDSIERILMTGETIATESKDYQNPMCPLFEESGLLKTIQNLEKKDDIDFGNLDKIKMICQTFFEEFEVSGGVEMELDIKKLQIK